MEDYETLYSEWLPVPPVQTDVNIGLMSKEKPEIVEYTVDDNKIILSFSKYMDISTINQSSIIISGDEKNYLMIFHHYLKLMKNYIAKLLKYN